MKRIQQKRTKGWRMPPNTISVARPGKRGNPFPVKADTPPWKSLRLFVLHLAEMEPARLDELVNGLVGHDVACWCPPKACCHVDHFEEVLKRVQSGEFPFQMSSGEWFSIHEMIRGIDFVELDYWPDRFDKANEVRRYIKLYRRVLNTVKGFVSLAQVAAAKGDES